MDIKRITALTAAAALLSTVPALAATQNGSVTVKWNTQASATLALNTNYSATGAQQLTAPAIAAQVNGGSGACTATGAGSEAAGVVNFGAVTPDGGANITDCQYASAVNAVVTTNSTNWTLSEAAAAAPPAGSALCAYANDTALTANSGTAKTFPFKPSAAALAALQTQYAGAAVTNNTLGTCATSGQAITTTPFNLISAASNGFTAAAPANLGEDIELQISSANATGAQQVVVNYTLVAN